MWGNVGTPLILASFFHLFLGNLLLGLFEGLALMKFFESQKKTTILLLVGANFASAWGGVFLLGKLLPFADITILNLWSWFALGLVLAFLLTLLLEFPFVWLSLKGRESSLRLAGQATLLIHTASYLLLCACYGMMSRATMLTELQVISAGGREIPGDYQLYYLEPTGAQVWRLQLNAPHRPEVVLPLEASGQNDRLYAKPHAGGEFNLFLYQKPKGGRGRHLLLQENFSPHAALDWHLKEQSQVRETFHHFGPVPSLAENAAWKLRTGFWAFDGLSGENQASGERIHYALETPMAMWTVRNAVHLPGDFVVFQLGEEQICLLDLQEKSLALLARGRGPLVARAKGLE
ncbi:hypothetical protein [Roseibacillus ishigakijimensis]|nr:hypothetical protein [Roseibacillus ishigakijimensis]